MYRFALLISVLIYGCSSGGIDVRNVKAGATERGIASWYGEPYHGRRTASGEIYDMYQLTAAHRSLDFGTVVEVTRRDTGASIDVRINDRGPFIRGRIIDLSYSAAQRIGLDIDGVAAVEIRVLDRIIQPKKPPNSEVSQRFCFWVQVGAFGDQENADRAVKTLKANGEEALAIEGPKGLLRVRIGPFTNSKNRDAALERLRDEWPHAAIVECGE